MLKFVEITDEKRGFAEEIFHRIFSWYPETTAFPSFDKFTPEEVKTIKALMKKFNNVSHIVYDGDKVVGLEGVYHYPGSEDSGWLSWFGVVPEERRNHYGAEILKMHEDDLRKYGYKFSRLYTESENNEKTRKFYESQGYTGEPYCCPEDPLIPFGSMTVYSKSLGDYPLEPWNNRSMYLTVGEKYILTEEAYNNYAEFSKEMTKRNHE